MPLAYDSVAVIRHWKIAGIRKGISGCVLIDAHVDMFVWTWRGLLTCMEE